MSAEEKKIKDEYQSRIDLLDTMVSVASENGLFDSQQDNILDNILRKLKDARNNIEKCNPAQLAICDYDLSTAAAYYFKAINSAPRSWRFLNIYAIPIWIYLISFLSVIFMFYYFDINFFISDQLSLLNDQKIVLDVVAWGVIGGILRGLWWLWQNINKKTYRKVWIMWFISTPFLGGILGAISYFLILAGLVALNQDENADPNPMLLIIVAAFAGFNWEWIIEQFNRVKERL